jgi:NADH:ubiquinone oxidoreductase subunit 5 (subunit L)/multisubunit Na+/H+ antiporter MnhA subunit
LFDNRIIDGMVNVVGNTTYAVGSWMRVFQTGLIRNYILFLAFAAVGIFAILSYVIAFAG